MRRQERTGPFFDARVKNSDVAHAACVKTLNKIGEGTLLVST